MYIVHYSMFVVCHVNCNKKISHSINAHKKSTLRKIQHGHFWESLRWCKIKKRVFTNYKFHTDRSTPRSEHTPIYYTSRDSQLVTRKSLREANGGGRVGGEASGGLTEMAPTNDAKWRTRMKTERGKTTRLHRLRFWWK